MVSLFVSISLECLGYFRIAFPVCLAAHGDVHAYLSAFACEMILQSLEYFRVNILRYAKPVFVSPCDFAFRLCDFYEFI